MPFVARKLKTASPGEVKSRERLLRESTGILTSFAFSRCLIFRNMGDWFSGLSGSFENRRLCIKTCFCPCIVAGEIGEALGGSCCYHGFCSLMGPIGICCGAQNRKKIREENQIPVSWSLLSCLLGERNIYD